MRTSIRSEAGRGIVEVLCLQPMVGRDKSRDLEQVAEMLETAIHGTGEQERRPDIVVLPEMFNCPYQTDLFPDYAEEIGGETTIFLSSLAAQHGVYLVGGSIPERCGGQIFNTCLVFDRKGEQILHYRKRHLFDVDIEGGQVFHESDTLTPGTFDGLFQTEFGPMGVMVCFDVRFPELAASLAERGAGIIFVPASFNMTTGPAHWELLFRARAVDDQCYMIGCSSACDHDHSYHSYGHSIAVSPWGTVLGQLDDEVGRLRVCVDLDEIERMHGQIPLRQARVRAARLTGEQGEGR